MEEERIVVIRVDLTKLVEFNEKLREVLERRAKALAST